MLVQAGKYRTEDKLKNTENTQTKHNAEKANTSKQQLQSPGSVASYDTRPGNEVQCSRALTGTWWMVNDKFWSL